MASGLKHLALLMVVPLSIAAVTGLAAGPLELDGPEPDDDHTRPDPYNQPTLPPELVPIPSENHTEYPLAAQFIPADPSNYTPGGIVSHDYVVVHTMQGYYEGAISWFQNPSSDVSAHFCMRSDDGEITQMVHLDDRAWHVGSSNSYAIGIEHEGFVDDASWYTWAMYSSSALLARWLADQYDLPLDRDHIVAHSELPNQTHTDPGPNWNWDWYMALIRDVVSAGVAEGYVVDRSRLCTITATGDTWIKKTLEASADLSDTDKCFVAAGTEITYLHATVDMAGHKRLTYEAGGGPCDGIIDLDTQGFIFAGHFTDTCPDGDAAAVGLTVSLDGGAQVVTDGNGYFNFIEVGPGAHSLDVAGNGVYYDTTEPIDIDVYPGVRSIIVVDPIANPGDGDGDNTTGDGDGDGTCWVGGLGCPCTDGGGCDPGLVCEPSTNTCEPEDGASGTDGGTGMTSLGAEGIDYLPGDACSQCSLGDSDEGQGAIGLALLGLLGLVRRRRD